MDPLAPESSELQAREQMRLGDVLAVPRLVVALTDQAEYAAALSLALEAHEAIRARDFAAWAGLVNYIVVCCGQLGLADVATPFIEALAAELRNSQQPAEQAWPGSLLTWIDRPEAASVELRAGLSRHPGAPYLLQELGRCQLMLGDLTGIGALRQFASPAFWAAYYQPLPAPTELMWHGEPIAGKRLRVVPHGGIGDAIHFVRHARALRATGVREVLFEVANPQLVPLLASAPDVKLVPPGTAVADDQYDCWTSTFGLGLHLLEQHGLRNCDPYLRAPESPLAESLVRLARTRAKGRRCMGLWWHSDAQWGALKSVPLPALLPALGLPGIHWVVFQRGIALRQFQLAGLDGHCTVVPESATLGDEAHLISHLDGMVAIDSFALHMAGALGCRTWMLAGRFLDWRYLNAQQTSPLYMNSRVCRQPRLGDWRGAVRQLCEELSA